MTADKRRVAAVVVLGLALLGLYSFWPTSAPPLESGAARELSPPGTAAREAGGLAPSGHAAPSEATPREAVAAPGTAGRGDLVVRLLYGDDRSPAADVMVTAFRKNETPRNVSAPSVDAKRCRTDAAGIARFPSMRAGRTGLIADRGHWYEKAYVVSGKATEVEFVMPVGVAITGVVVSAAGTPVPGADVELESTTVATTDEHGRFAVRGASPHYSIGARAAGHGASKAQQLIPRDGRADVRLELGVAGGTVEGTAVDPDGKPLANVRVDIGRYEGGRSWVADAPPRPARPRTDGEGRFRAIGVPLGEQPVRAHASGFVPWSGTCRVGADAPAVVHVVFARGNTLRGTLHDAEGRPVGDTFVSAHAGETSWEEVIAPDGTFELTGLPDGEVEVKVDAEAKGEARERVTMLPAGAVTTCALTLVCGFVAKGKVRDEAGHGLRQVNVRWSPAPNGRGYTFTDDDGAFAIANVPEGKLTISLDGDDIADAHFEDLDPRAGELDLRAQRRAPKTVYIAGIVLDPDGRPATARVWASGGGSNDIVECSTDAAGYFEIGPVPPGNWHVGIETRTFPRVSLKWRQLDPETRWDLGTIRLAAGGDVRVEVEGATDGAWFSVFDAEQRAFALRVEDGRGTSEVLPVGSYRLFAAGKTQAAQSIPFEVRAGGTTKVSVRLRPGVRQRFAITAPVGIPPTAGSVQITRGVDRLAYAYAKYEEGKPCVAERCLEPGDYAVTARFGELEGSATFTVSEHEGEPVRIVVARPPK